MKAYTLRSVTRPKLHKDISFLHEMIIRTVIHIVHVINIVNSKCSEQILWCILLVT